MPDEQEKPRAKDGGVWAGVATVIREIGEVVQTSGGIVVVIIGVSAVLTIATAALGTVPDGQKATVATAAFGVLGTIVGAYFGVRVGAHDKEQVDEERKTANAKVERLAAQLDSPTATRILTEVEKSREEGQP